MGLGVVFEIEVGCLWVEQQDQFQKQVGIVWEEVWQVYQQGCVEGDDEGGQLYVVYWYQFGQWFL